MALSQLPFWQDQQNFRLTSSVRTIALNQMFIVRAALKASTISKYGTDSTLKHYAAPSVWPRDGEL